MMNTLKKFSLLLFIAGLSMEMSAQETQQKPMPAKETKEVQKPKKLKKHVCTKACHTAGHHVYKHGEKGHVCDANCKM